MLAEFSIFPMDGAHMSEDIARVIEILEARDLDFRLGAMGTTVEGDWEPVMAAIQACHQAMANDHPRVITTIVIDSRKEGSHRLDEMVSSVEQHVGHRIKR